MRVLLVLASLQVVSGTQCETSNSIYGYGLSSRAIGTQRADDMMMCIQKCRKEYNCLSVNYQMVDGLCKLQNANRNTPEAELKVSEHTIYMEDIPNSKPTCPWTSPCKNGGTCYVENHASKCICPKGYNGKECENGPPDCETLRAAGVTASGVHKIYPEGMESIIVYCDMSTAAGGWTMIFKTVSGVLKQGAVNLWINDNLTSDEDSTESLSNFTNSTQMYKNRLVQNWQKFNPKEVLILVYKNGVADLQLKFNATGSDNTNWYQKSRLLESPWTDLVSGLLVPTKFVLIGCCSRMFYTMSGEGGCDNDMGWLMVAATACHYELNHKLNTIIYSKSTTIHFRLGGYETADVMAVYVR
ncbi:predicted protein [Nematostella vectensis]|uniref:Uncharacterized protein n=1 Tax=Nematostella vectensis TaxID=45351 RepID=A7RQH4_NEMVE|nr:uncharacterized protein LOC5518400 [Nematostella vectensis]EDO46367.1 predicted protein [Nematostella vectensis]|eukprot:XP_001638430.1 predicted protein [Nematostella vectensis]